MEKRIIMSPDEYEELEADSNRLEYFMSLFKVDGQDVILNKTSILSIVLSKQLVDEGYEMVRTIYGSGKAIALEGFKEDGQTKEMELDDYEIKIQ